MDCPLGQADRKVGFKREIREGFPCGARSLEQKENRAEVQAEDGKALWHGLRHGMKARQRQQAGKAGIRIRREREETIRRTGGKGGPKGSRGAGGGGKGRREGE